MLRKFCTSNFVSIFVPSCYASSCPGAKRYRSMSSRALHLVNPAVLCPLGRQANADRMGSGVSERVAGTGAEEMDHEEFGWCSRVETRKEEKASPLPTKSPRG